MNKIFLSPHFDDVALSCGGIVAMSSSAGEEVLVVTICAAVPSEDAVSGFARRLHRCAGFSDGPSYVMARREEDRSAAAVLNARFEWGASLDAIYRCPESYDLESALFGPPDPSDSLAYEAERLIQDLRRRFPRATIYAPMGLGGHVDHLLISQAARAIGSEIVFYEEFPYASRSDDATLGSSEVVDIGPRVDDRIRSSLCYRSQIRLLFGTEARARTAILERVATIGGERIWRAACEEPSI